MNVMDNRRKLKQYKSSYEQATVASLIGTYIDLYMNHRLDNKDPMMKAVFKCIKEVSIDELIKGKEELEVQQEKTTKYESVIRIGEAINLLNYYIHKEKVIPLEKIRKY